MALFLKEHQVGFDTQRIGFPGLGNCMAVAMLTEGGLYGFHFTPTALDQIDVVRAFVERQRLFSGVPDDALHLYGSCRFGMRFSGVPNAERAWQTLMTGVAQALRYQGPVTGCNLSAVKHGERDDAAGKSIYLEYARTPGATDCAIQYKRMSKIALTAASVTGADLGPGQGVRQVKKAPGPSGRYSLGEATHALVSDARLGPNATTMHSPSRSALVRFSV
jgi:hypothetical protein